jgi:hypothetical protein
LKPKKVKLFVTSAMEALKYKISKFSVTDEDNRQFEDISRILGDKI